jgi:type VI protein secretion system component VasK
VNRLFRPQDGALWRFYQENLQNLIVKEGTQWVAKPGGTMSVTPAFLAFFNRAAAFSEAVYKGGQEPQLTYSLRSNLAGQNQTIELTIDGQTLSNGPGRTVTQQFRWPGKQPGGVRMTVRFGGEPFQWPRYDGLWAAFDFFADGEEKAQVSGSVYTLEWTLRTGATGRQVTTASGQPVSVRLDLDMMGAPPVFRKGYFAGWNCVSEVAR